MGRMLRLVAVLLPLGLLACGVTDITPVPEGFPLNPCPIAGPGSVTPREGYRLVPPGEIAFAYQTWHNETPNTFVCGAQSVQGDKAIIAPSDFPSGLLPWVATYRRAVPLQAPEPAPPEGRLFSIGPAGPTLVETIALASSPQYGVLGNLFERFPDPAPGVYRLQIVSSTGEVLATGEFELRR